METTSTRDRDSPSWSGRPRHALLDGAVFAGVAVWSATNLVIRIAGPQEWRGPLTLAALAVAYVLLGCGFLIGRGRAPKLRIGPVPGGAGPGLLFEGSDRMMGYLGIGLVALLGSQFVLRTQLLSDSALDWVQLAEWIIVVIAATVLAVRALGVNPALAVWPGGVALDTVRYRGHVPWDRLSLMTSAGLIGPQPTLVFDPPLEPRRRPLGLRIPFLGVRPVGRLSLQNLVRVDRNAVAVLIDHYRARPEHRSELTTKRAIERLEAFRQELKVLRPPWPPPPPDDDRPGASSGDG